MSLVADAVESLKQEGPQHLFGGHRRAPEVHVQRAELRRQRRKRTIRNLADRSQRVIGRDPLLQRDVAEHRTRALVCSAHLLLQFPHEMVVRKCLLAQLGLETQATDRFTGKHMVPSWG